MNVGGRVWSREHGLKIWIRAWFCHFVLCNLGFLALASHCTVDQRQDRPCCAVTDDRVLTRTLPGETSVLAVIIGIGCSIFSGSINWFISFDGKLRVTDMHELELCFCQGYPGADGMKCAGE